MMITTTGMGVIIIEFLGWVGWWGGENMVMIDVDVDV
jgi:hypothetical protein